MALANQASTSAAASLVKTGTGLLNLDANNTYTGGTTVAPAPCKSPTSAPSGTGILVANGGVLDLAGSSLTVPGFGGLAGTITTSVPGSLALTVSQTAATSFGGTIQNGAGVLSLVFSGGGWI